MGDGMNRVRFTDRITRLIRDMIEQGESPIIDYVKRSDEEQMRLFLKKLSKCDGIKNPSAHQSGRAMDIYFIRDGELKDPEKGWEYWHKVWESLGGQPMISWDKGHFE